jgi:Outer membrane lipoprotein-sorting protein
MFSRLTICLAAAMFMSATVHADAPAANPIAPSAGFGTTPAALTVADIIQKMETPRVSEHPAISRGMVVHRVKNGDTQLWRMAVTRRLVGNDTLTLMVFDTGSALLAGIKDKTGERIEALYIPFEERVREMTPVYPEDAFLGSDLTKADVGLAEPGKRTFELLESVEFNHRAAFKIEEKPQYPSEFSRVVTWIASDDWMPMKREYFDRADRLWKVAQYQGVVIDGRPTVTYMDMKDVQSQSETEYVIYDIRYDASVPEDFFRVERLGRTAKEFKW